MDFLMRSLLRKYETTKDPLLAIEIAEMSLRLLKSPTAQTEAFYKAFFWLVNHPAFYYNGPPARDKKEPGFWRALDVEVVKVDPVTHKIEDDKGRNTHVEFWLEAGPWNANEDHPDMAWDDWTGVPTHDYDLDCSGDSFEEAILNMAELVKTKYGDYQHSE